ncbi:MAG: Smr/MutS family protein [Geobacteraceae bacterium]|nr:Smr/MutS family protein [Geobacteraceae bacterium]
MKKSRKKEEKRKEFGTSPFKGLKTFSVATANPPEKVVVKETPSVKPVEEDDGNDLFLRYVEGVKRLEEPPRKKAPPPIRSEDTRSGRDQEEQQLFLSALAGMDVTFRDEFPEVEPLRPIATNRLRQLKSGAIRVDLELDLHGLTRDEALTSLSRFVTGAYNRGQKAILVITGKGNNSPAEPVLQGAVASWLRETGKKMVAEFAPAPRQMGGSGAFVVFLKEKNN